MRDPRLVSAGFPILLATASLTCTGGSVQPEATLSVTLAANPPAGTAPLDGVELTASVAGTATGPIRYRFDCSDDGSYEVDVEVTGTRYTTTSPCSYPAPGDITAVVLVDREGVSAEAMAAITVVPRSLTVRLTANPSSGTAPLNAVSLTASPGGNGTGAILYRFDCTGDGGFEVVVSVSDGPFTVLNACNYPDPGLYLPRVVIDRQGLMAEATAEVEVTP